MSSRGARRIRPLGPLGVSGALLLLAVACSTGDTGHPAAPTVTGPPAASSGFPADWEPEELSWGDCGPEVRAALECSTLTVPLDWADPTGPTIELALARSRTTGERLGNLVTNPGGPGASGIDFIARSPLAGTLAESFDIVSWDPRGVGRSTSVDCDDAAEELYLSDPTPEDETERLATATVAQDVVAACEASAADLLEHLHTEEVARDLEAIRLALGPEKLNYLGFSYGTHIGQEYAELFGERVRAMTLDGVVDPAAGFEEFLLGQAEAFEASFEAQTEACSEAGEATCGVEDLAAAYDAVSEMAESSRIDAGGEPLEPAQVATAAIYTGYFGQGWQTLGPALAEALRGEGADLADLAESYVELGSYGPYAGVVCTDSSHPVGLAQYDDFIGRAAGVSPRFGASIALEMLPCATWPVAPQDSAEALSAANAPPILVVGNTGDAATPLANAESVADSLDNGVLLVVDSQRHTAYGSDECATRIVDSYFVELDVPESGMRC